MILLRNLSQNSMEQPRRYLIPTMIRYHNRSQFSPHIVDFLKNKVAALLSDLPVAQFIQ
jgi:hypothetical protein